jgi:hypothetical protein
MEVKDTSGTLNANVTSGGADPSWPANDRLLFDSFSLLATTPEFGTDLITSNNWQWWFK